MFAMNTSPVWTGDYRGIPGIRMWLNNLGSTTLHLRLLLADFAQLGMPAHIALSAEAVVLEPGSGWSPVVFPIGPASLVSGGFGTVDGALANADVLRIFHNPEPTFPGPMQGGIPDIEGVLGIDNIATAVPEPSTAALLLAGIAAAGALGRKWVR
jgi:hypothetical protein